MARSRITRSQGVEFQLTGRKVASLLAHAASWYTTYLFIYAMAGEGNQQGAVFISIGLEIFLYICKKHLITKNHRDPVGLASAFFDTLLNAGGLWPSVMSLNKSTSWQMLASSFQVGTTVSPLSGAIIALAVGGILSAAPILLGEEE